jgi:hypothetical protein
MHNQELLRHAFYDQDNSPSDDLYIIPAAHASSASPGVVNNFPAFSRRLRTIRYPKDFKPASEKYDGQPTSEKYDGQSTSEKYDGCSDPSIWLLMDKTRIHLRSASVQTYTFFTTGSPRFLSIRGARVLLALNQVLI